MSVRLLHTADVHLGAAFKVLGEGGAEQRAQVRRTFEAVVALTIAERADAVLIAGDLFDSPSAARAQAAFVAEQCDRLGDAGIPVCAIAGNHDPLEPAGGGVWQELAARCPGLTVFGAQVEARVFPERDLTVVGRSIRRPGQEDHAAASSPLAGWRDSAAVSPRRTRYLAGIAHGSLRRPNFPEMSGQITAEDIAMSGLDYLALGDWHSAQDVSAGEVTAWYSGSPELLDLDQVESGSVCLVTVRAPGDVEVERRRVGRRRAERLVIDVGVAGSTDAIARRIRERADPDLALLVTLTGLAGVGDQVFADRLRDDLASEFFRLDIRNESRLRPGPIDPAQYPEQTVLGRFVRGMQARIAASEGEARAVAEDALAYGVALLQGKTEVLG